MPFDIPAGYAPVCSHNDHPWWRCPNLPNVWGNDPVDINADEYCPFCEREVPFHYDNCPTREK